MNSPWSHPKLVKIQETNCTKGILFGSNIVVTPTTDISFYLEKEHSDMVILNIYVDASFVAQCNFENNNIIYDEIERRLQFHLNGKSSSSLLFSSLNEEDQLKIWVYGNIPSSNVQFSLLYKAAEVGNLSLVKYLVINNCSPATVICNKTENDGNTALLYAAFAGQTNIVNYLTEVDCSLLLAVNYKNESVLFSSYFSVIDAVMTFAEQQCSEEGNDFFTTNFKLLFAKSITLPECPECIHFALSRGDLRIANRLVESWAKLKMSPALSCKNILSSIVQK